MIQQKIKEDVKVSMKERDSLKTEVLRGLLSAFTNELLKEKRKPDESLEEEKVLEVLQRNVKQRRDSIEQFKKGGREELAEKEEKEIEIIQKYLPKMMEKEEVENFVKQKAEELGVTEKTEMGKLIGAVMQELKGKAEGADVKEAVENMLS